MWFDSGIADYADAAWKINCAYGQRHGVDVVRSDEKRDGRRATWQRMKLMLEFIERYDYVVWCDADAAFNVRGQSLEAFIRAHDYPDSILSEDSPDSWSNFRDGKMSVLSEAHLRATNINAGVVVVRNSPAGLRLLEQWDRSEGFTNNDQTPLRYLYYTFIRGLDSGFGRMVKVPYGVLQVFPKGLGDAMRPQTPEPLVFHMAGRLNWARVTFFTALLPISTRALNQTLFYLDELKSSNLYDQELRTALETSWRRVGDPNEADVKILMMSDERNYPDFKMDGGPGMTKDPKRYLDGRNDLSGAAVITFDLCGKFVLPKNAINVAFSQTRSKDIVIAPPALHGRTAPQEPRQGEKDVLASFKGKRSRVSAAGKDVRAQSFARLLPLHDDRNFIVCDGTDARYDYDDLLARSQFAIVLEGDLPWSYRLTEAVFHGCVPLFIQEDFLVLPHEDLVDWSAMCLRLPLSRAHEARSAAEAALGELPRMRAALRCYCAERLQTRALEAEAILATHSARYGVAGRVHFLTRTLEGLPPIPKKIHVTWKNKHLLDDPAAVTFAIVKHGLQALKALNPTWTLEISDDADVEAYLRSHLSAPDYDLLKDKRIVEKTDLWRLLKVYHEGGCYCDIDRVHDSSLDAGLLSDTRVLFPTWEDLNCSQDFMLSAPGAPHFWHAVQLNLEGRRQGKPLYELGPPAYWEAVTELVLGYPVLHERASAHVWAKFRSIVEACKHAQTLREEPFKTFTYRGKALRLDKEDFYAASSVVHWSV